MDGLKEWASNQPQVISAFSHRRRRYLSYDVISLPSLLNLNFQSGKIYNPGFDQYGRAIVVFDNTVQNTTVHADQMTLLAWSLELAIREMAPHTDK